MTQLHNRQLYLHQRPVGVPTEEDIRMRTVLVPDLQEGEVLIENHYLSLDPAIRDWMSDNDSYLEPIPLGGCIRSTTLGKVLKSNHSAFSEGDYVQGLAVNGWEELTVNHGDLLTQVPNDGNYSPRNYLSIFSGAMGLTPYFGLLELGQPVEGDTVLMSAAAGAVGSIAGQIAKIKGCRVVGLTGNAEKASWLTDTLGFDAAINYKTCDNLADEIARVCPERVDIFYDNVGGDMLDAALLNLNDHARVVFCGAISTYNSSGSVPGPYNYWQILARSATVKGLLTTNYVDRFDDAIAEIKTWLEQGKLIFNEDIVEGLENTVEAYSRLFSGANKGKLLVKLAAADC
ncbi:NADP-dependent oxidoreductase [Aestuariicella hydrocarbonica]|uniref:NADP-dependent oxidoreductase n=1 Tax=Pseudomaricurvus hydrocarbonicus TaxID=1470433 RepID=A0A9E5JU35_9GAMM|nr:NADP-dependent oxidoreductase [Aestuariicella hydrocarbonica]NHO66858.1 NADP-dependent oxidoreductase [Aestuariicella hydrocarbonica]